MIEKLKDLPAYSADEDIVEKINEIIDYLNAKEQSAIDEDLRIKKEMAELEERYRCNTSSSIKGHRYYDETY